MSKIIRFDVDVFRSPGDVRLWFWKTKLQLMLESGHPIALIGACRTGKTLLLHEITNNIIDKQPEAISTGRSEFPLDVSEIPAGVFGIDECQLIEPQSLENVLLPLAEQRRTFVLCSQRFSAIKDAINAYQINAYRYDENRKPLVIVVMGGHRNPQMILDELPQEQS